MERWRGLFIAVFTLVVVAAVASFLAWTRDTERWHLFGAYFVVLAIVIWRVWDWRPPD